MVLQPALPEKKRTLFFFVGDARLSDPKYSHGVRQAVMLLNNTPGRTIPGTYIPT